jgi:hypothetical protein
MRRETYDPKSSGRDADIHGWPEDVASCFGDLIFFLMQLLAGFDDDPVVNFTL